MQLTRCHCQGKQTLEEYYAELSADERIWVRGKPMLSLLARLRALPDERQVWGLTSNDQLCLRAQDSEMAPSFVIIAALGMGDDWGYVVDYLMPERVAPWRGAMVRGGAHTEDDAVRMILTAMKNSEGWP
jgi:hypothetical protein